MEVPIIHVAPPATYETPLTMDSSRDHCPAGLIRGTASPTGDPRVLGYLHTLLPLTGDLDKV